MSFLSRIFPGLSRRSGIEAGGGGRRWDGAPVLGNPQQSTLAARPVTKARASAAYLNNPLANRVVEGWGAALIGKGWNARSGHPDATVARALNDEFEALILPLLPLAARSLVRDGEAFIRILVDEDGQVLAKVLPADQIDNAMSRDLGNGARIVSGIEFDAQDRVVAYHVLPEAPGTAFSVFGDPIRVPASDMLHIFDQLFPGQVRGLSWLAPVLLKLRDRDEASDALLMQLKVAALVTGFIRDPEGAAAGFEGETSAAAINVALEPGAMRVLPPGADVAFSNPGQGLSQADQFLKMQDREIAAGVGMTYEALTGDLTGANYSSARVGLLEFRRRAEMLQRVLIEGQLLRPLWRRWINLKALAGEITPQGAALSQYHAVRFVPPGWQWVDPLKEVNADVRAIEAGLKSRAEVVAARGRDIDELDEEMARDQGQANQGGQE